MKKETAKLNRIAGQIKALSRMVEENTNCKELIIQFQAAKSALNSVFNDVLNNNLDSCLRSNDEKELKQIIKEISKK